MFDRTTPSIELKQRINRYFRSLSQIRRHHNVDEAIPLWKLEDMEEGQTFESMPSAFVWEFPTRYANQLRALVESHNALMSMKELVHRSLDKTGKDALCGQLCPCNFDTLKIVLRRHELKPEIEYLINAIYALKQYMRRKFRFEYTD